MSCEAWQGFWLGFSPLVLGRDVCAKAASYPPPSSFQESCRGGRLETASAFAFKRDRSLKKRQKMAYILGFLYPCERPRRGSCLPALE